MTALDVWLGITYPRLLDHAPVQYLWRRVFCPMGWHLWDEVWSLEDHVLFCDACEMEIKIDDAAAREEGPHE